MRLYPIRLSIEMVGKNMDLESAQDGVSVIASFSFTILIKRIHLTDKVMPSHSARLQKVGMGFYLVNVID